MMIENCLLVFPKLKRFLVFMNRVGFSGKITNLSDSMLVVQGSSNPAESQPSTTNTPFTSQPSSSKTPKRKSQQTEPISSQSQQGKETDS